MRCDSFWDRKSNSDELARFGISGKTHIETDCFSRRARMRMPSTRTSKRLNAHNNQSRDWFAECIRRGARQNPSIHTASKKIISSHHTEAQSIRFTRITPVRRTNPSEIRRSTTPARLAASYDLDRMASSSCSRCGFCCVREWLAILNADQIPMGIVFGRILIARERGNGDLYF